jgi:hypothetical protein
MLPIRRPVGPRFFHKIVRLNSVTLIRSICEDCGAMQECSARDTSLQDWEQAHDCSAAEQARAYA